MPVRYDHNDLQQFSTRLFVAAGLAEDRAAVMAEVFLEADLLGFTTHGMNRVAHNVRWLLSGESRSRGDPEVLVDPYLLEVEVLVVGSFSVTQLE